jgi:hypothetical protein
MNESSGNCLKFARKGFNMPRIVRKALSASPVAPALALVLLTCSSSYADITYTDFASWAAADPAYLTVTIPDPAPAPFTYIGTGDTSVTYSGVQFSQTGDSSTGPYLFDIGSLDSGLPAVLSSAPQPGGTGEANILITLPESVTGLALDYGTANGDPVTFTVSDGAVITQPSTSGASFAGVPDFFGVTSSTPINSVLLTTPDPDLNLNNVSFLPASPGPSVPEPAAWPMLAGCFGLLIATRLRFKGRKA